MQGESWVSLQEFLRRLSEYLPSLTAGLLVLALGLVVGWIVKRAVIRVLIWLRIDRLGERMGWRAAFGKGDVRAAMYDLAGNLSMVLVILVFLDNALEILQLSVLSRMIDDVVFYLPNLLLVALIVIVGGLVAHVSGARVARALAEEGVARARLLGKTFKGILLLLVGALALWQLDLGRQIVLTGFAVIFGALGVAFAIAVGLGSVKAIGRVWGDAGLERENED